jgi:hypothetical protein
MVKIHLFDGVFIIVMEEVIFRLQEICEDEMVFDDVVPAMRNGICAT